MNPNELAQLTPDDLIAIIKNTTELKGKVEQISRTNEICSQLALENLGISEETGKLKTEYDNLRALYISGRDRLKNSVHSNSGNIKVKIK